MAPLTFVIGRIVPGIRIADWVASALENGATAWCHDLAPSTEFRDLYTPRYRRWYADDRLWTHPKLGVRFQQDGEPERSGVRTARHLQRALDHLAQHRPRTLNSLMGTPGSWDADDADTFLQTFLIGEVVF